MLRMYLRWAESKGFKADIIEVSAGDVAGIKSATVQISGEYAFGWLRTEIVVCIAWYVSLHSTPAAVVTRLSLLCLFLRKSTTT